MTRDPIDIGQASTGVVNSLLKRDFVARVIERGCVSTYPCPVSCVMSHGGN